jgi:hypothetical protein
MRDQGRRDRGGQPLAGGPVGCGAAEGCEDDRGNADRSQKAVVAGIPFKFSR